MSEVVHLRPAPACFCGQICAVQTSAQMAPHKTPARFFFACRLGRCDFFDFADAPKRDKTYLEHYRRIGYDVDRYLTTGEPRENKRARTEGAETAERGVEHVDEVDGGGIGGDKGEDPNPSARFDYVMQSKTDKAALSFVQCLVCLEPMVEPRTTPCEHSFCEFCLLQLTEKGMDCAACRAPFEVNQLREPDATLVALLGALEGRVRRDDGRG